MGFVYENEAGARRFVVSVDHDRESYVVIWRTSEPNLSKGAKAQGSATVTSFRRWAVKIWKATPEDWRVFQQVERRRVWNKRDTESIRRIKQSVESPN